MLSCRTCSPALLPALLLLSACGRTLDTLPPRPSPSAPPHEQTLYLPPGLEIRSVDYTVALYSDVSGGGGTGGIAMPTTTSVGGRGFVKVYAIDRETGEQVLLLYENITQRPHPIQIIRFRSDESTASRTAKPPA